MKNPIKLCTGEVPRTTFHNMEKSLKVELIDSYLPTDALVEMAKSPQSPLPPTAATMDPRMKAALEGEGMWMLEEIPMLTLKITGVSRTFTHQLVRQRVGVTFMQQCTGDVDFRHCNIVVPGCIAKSDRDWEEFSVACLEAKMAYARMLDRGVSLHSARYVLPHGIETFIYMQAPLVTIANLWKKRSCTMTQAWEMVLFARRMRDAVLLKYPQFAKILGDPCGQGTCWYQKVRETGVEPPLWYPDDAHDIFEFNPDDYIYPGTNQACSSPSETRLPASYIGRVRV